MPPLKGRVYTYVTLAVLVYSVMVPVKFLSLNLLSFLDSPTGPILSDMGLSSDWIWMSVLVLVIGAPLTEEFMYRGFCCRRSLSPKSDFGGRSLQMLRGQPCTLLTSHGLRFLRFLCLAIVADR
jgi:membrane protease YdiL (CAAX protease family)